MRIKDKKLNKIEKQKAEKDGLKVFEDLDDYALKGWEEMDEVDYKCVQSGMAFGGDQKLLRDSI